MVSIQLIHSILCLIIQCVLPENLGEKSSVDDAEDDQEHSIPVKHFDSEATPQPQDSVIQSAD